VDAGFGRPARRVGPRGPAPVDPFEKTVLPNGLELILVEDHRLPVVAVNLWYHVGPANEKPGLTGFAHLFGHMMFAGSRHLPRGAADTFLEGAGGKSSRLYKKLLYERQIDQETDAAQNVHADLLFHARRHCARR
jgi:zinc protease